MKTRIKKLLHSLFGVLALFCPLFVLAYGGGYRDVIKAQLSIIFIIFIIFLFISIKYLKNIKKDKEIKNIKK